MNSSRTRRLLICAILALTVRGVWGQHPVATGTSVTTVTVVAPSLPIDPKDLPAVMIAQPMWQRSWNGWKDKHPKDTYRASTDFDALQLMLATELKAMADAKDPPVDDPPPREWRNINEYWVMSEDKPGQVYGHLPASWTKPGDPLEERDTMFVTTPVKRLGNRILVFCTHWGPAATEVYIVDKNLKVEILYPVTDVPSLPYVEQGYHVLENGRVGRMQNVRVMGGGRYLLQQQMGSQRPPEEEDVGRLIDLRLDEKHFSIEEIPFDDSYSEDQKGVYTKIESFNDLVKKYPEYKIPKRLLPQ